MDHYGVKIALLLVFLSLFVGSSSEFLRPPQSFVFNKFRPQTSVPEPSFFQRITSWIFPWGGVSREEYHNMIPIASSKIDNPSSVQYAPVAKINPAVQVINIEPTTVRATITLPIKKCSPCNKIPWIPIQNVQQVVKSNGQQQQISFKHHFENENQYTQMQQSGYKYDSSSTESPTTKPLKMQDDPYAISPHLTQRYQPYGIPQIKNIHQDNQYSTRGSLFPRVGTTLKPNTIDTSVITFTTHRPQHGNFDKRPFRFTASSSVTNSEYIPPPNVLPLEGENSLLAPIPIPNLSLTPIPPLFDAKPFHDNPYQSQKTGFIKLVPLEPVAQLSSNINIHVPLKEDLSEFEPINEQPVEILKSNFIAEFTAEPEIVYGKDQTTQKYNHIEHLNVQYSKNVVIKAPIVVESLEIATADSAFAGSEQNYKHDIHQTLEAPLNQKFEIDETINGETNGFSLTRDNFQRDIETTTDGNYIVKFEPSLQTAADLLAEEAVKIKDKAKSVKKDRPTPLALLDSPISHITRFNFETTSSLPTKISEKPPPPFKPMEDFTKNLSTLWISPVPIITSTQATQTFSATQSTETLDPHPTTTMQYKSQIAGGAFSGIVPPREPIKPLPLPKKPKQIQIVIPYTTYHHKPSPFKHQDKNQEIITFRPIRGHYVTHPSRKTNRSATKNPIHNINENFNSHGYHNDQEIQAIGQESNIVESKVTTESPKSTKYITKILANNIRDLLIKEKTPKTAKIDIIKLQRNIDGWTEQSFLGKISTTSLMGHTKSIPKEFFNLASMKSTTKMKILTTTLSPKETFDSDLMEETKRQYANIKQSNDENLSYVKRHDRFLDRDNEVILINNNLTYNFIHDKIKIPPKPTTDALTPKELWKRLHITVSPLTNEKIIIITPQMKDAISENEFSTFRPRFAQNQRPTAGTAKKPKNLKPEKFKNANKYLEVTQVQTYDGHSRVVRIITPENPSREVTSSMRSTTKHPKFDN